MQQSIHDCYKLKVSVACQLFAQLSHFLTIYHLVTVVDSCCITRSHVFLLFFTFYFTIIYFFGNADADADDDIEYNLCS